jgi:hypothetical protein
MRSRDSGAPAEMTTLSQTPSGTPEDRRSAVAAFELCQRQWPTLFRGAAWLHLERLKKTIAEHEGLERKSVDQPSASHERRR